MKTVVFLSGFIPEAGGHALCKATLKDLGVSCNRGECSSKYSRREGDIDLSIENLNGS